MASTQGRLAELSDTIATLSQRIQEYLASKGQTEPSFLADGPVDLNLPPELEQSRLAVLEATQELNDLLQGPRDLLFNHYLLPLKFISKFKIAEKVPIHGEITYGDLAAEVGIDCAALMRILRLGIANRIFNEPRPGVVTHSAASRQIVDDARVADWVGANVDEMWPAALKTTEALVKWPLAAEPNQTGFAMAHDTSDSFYVEMGKSPERARRFGGAMSFFTTGEAFGLHHLANGHAWSSLGQATVVDVGGSHGDAAFALAREFDNLQLIVQELPEVVAACSSPPELKVQFMAHDFFTEQPVQGADIYLYRWVLHNWPDAHCLKILRALIPALKKGAKVLVMELVMPPPGVIPNILNKKIRVMDATMLEVGNSKERDLGEWKALFRQADERFVFTGVTQPPGSNLAIIEIIWGGGQTQA